MDYYLLLDKWAELVRDFKDAERTHNVEAYDAERVAREILNYARNMRIRQYNLFTQKRGEDFDKMMAHIEKSGLSLESARRFVENDELWTTTLEMGER
jgi:hypothetical protein